MTIGMAAREFNTAEHTNVEQIICYLVTDCLREVAGTFTVTLGIVCARYKSIKNYIILNASCTTNGLVPMVEVLDSVA